MCTFVSLVAFTRRFLCLVERNTKLILAISQINPNFIVCMYVKVYLKSLFKSVNTSVRLFKFTKKKSEITKSKISKYEKFKCLLVLSLLIQ